MPSVLKSQAGAFGKRPAAPAPRGPSKLPSSADVAKAYRRYYSLANRYEMDPRLGLRSVELQEYLSLRALLAPVIGA
jgi:hypothetical protein